MSLKKLAEKVRSEGRGPDDQLVHFTSRELAGLQSLAKASGGSLTINPKTGLPEAGFLDSLLPTIIGGAVGFLTMNPYLGAAAGAATGGAQAAANDQNVLMGAALGGLGGYGGAGLAEGLSATGAAAAGEAGAASAADTLAAQAAEQQAAQQVAANAAQQGIASGTGLTATPGMGTQFAQQGGIGLQAGATPYSDLYAMQGQGAGLQGAISTPTADATAARFTQGAATDEGRKLAISGYDAQPAWDRFSQGARAAWDNPSGYVDKLGGNKEAFKTAGMAAAPMYYNAVMAPQGAQEEDSGPGEVPKYKYSAEYVPGGYSEYPTAFSGERKYFTEPTFTRMAEGGDVQKPDVAKGMSGQSADAMRYLMGQAPTSSAAVTDVAAPKPVQVADLPSKYSTTAASRGLASFLRGGFTNPVARAMLGLPSTQANSGEQLYRQVQDGYTYDPTTQSYAPKYTYEAYSAPASGAYNDTTSSYSSRRWYAKGGTVGLKTGGFVFPADAVSALGNGSSSAGLEMLASKFGAKPIKGKGDGQSDSIKAKIDGKHRAAVARDEAYMTPAQVKKAGGAKKLYAMVDRIRMQAHGKTSQQRPVAKA